VLIDAGIGPRAIATRLADAGASWRAVRAILLTHTHDDHWCHSTIDQAARLRVPVYCHAAHVTALAAASPAFARLKTDGLVRRYEPDIELHLPGGVRATPLAVSHDGGPTFGFRLAGDTSLFGPAWSLGYAADLGTWDDALAAALAGVDLLALEFNHDVELQWSSGRPEALVRRVLGDQGHLSNAQASALLRAMLSTAPPAVPRQVVQLHLSRECNRPELARAAAQAVLDELGQDVEIHTASQERGTAPLAVRGGTGARGSLAQPTR
jgi:phosphoribosyl 1,2-cyclic phosphodiesterase